MLFRSIPHVHPPPPVTSMGPEQHCYFILKVLSMLIRTRSVHAGWGLEFINNFMGVTFHSIFLFMIFQGVENSWKKNFPYFQSSDKKTGALVTPTCSTATKVGPIRQLSWTKALLIREESSPFSEFWFSYPDCYRIAWRLGCKRMEKRFF